MVPGTKTDLAAASSDGSSDAGARGSPVVMSGATEGGGDKEGSGGLASEEDPMQDADLPKPVGELR